MTLVNTYEAEVITARENDLQVAERLLTMILAMEERGSPLNFLPLCMAFLAVSARIGRREVALGWPTA